MARAMPTLRWEGLGDFMKPDGGRAFPTGRFFESDKEKIGLLTGGMTMRDYFAATAMQSIVAFWRVPQAQANLEDGELMVKIADAAYRQADCMLTRRLKP